MTQDNNDPQLADAGQGISIHTGFPNAATDQRLQGLDLNKLLMPNPTSTFIFRVRGEQGAEHGIFDGDLAIIDRAQRPRPQDLILWHDGQNFALSKQSRLPPGVGVRGTLTAVVRQC